MNLHTEFSIDGRSIGTGHPPYVIAEMSANHNGRIETAFEILAAAKQAGVDAVKMQTYRADTITLDSDSSEFQITDGLWAGQTLYQLYESAHTPWEWHQPLFERAKALGLTLFSSPFDRQAVDLLEDLGAPAYKIASFEAIDLPLIKYVASTGKPLIISTGMANLEEIEEAVTSAREAGCRALALLHCVSAYPAPAQEYNLHVIPDLAQRFATVVGLSDHTLGLDTAIASVALGGSVVEKHVTLDRSGGGPDDSFSLQPEELAQLCTSVRTAWQALGRVDYGQQSSERGNVKFRRSLYFVSDLKSGDEITEADIRSVRPGYGLAPKYYDELIGRRVVRDVARHTPVSWDLVEK